MVEAGGIVSLGGGHGLDDGLGADQGFFVELDILHAAHARHHRQHILHGTHIFELQQLIIVICQRELGRTELFFQLHCLLFVHGCFGLFDEGKHVAHAQDAGGHAFGMEGLDLVELLSLAGELDGLAGDCAHREGRAAPRITVELGEDDTGDIQPLVEALGGIHRILTGHGVDHQQDLTGLYSSLDILELVHELLVDVQTARCVQKDHIIAVGLSVAHAGLGNIHRICFAHLEHGDIQLFAHHAQLLNGRGAINVAGHQQGAFTLLFQKTGQFAAVGGFACALQADQHNDRGALGIGGEFLVFRAHEPGQFLIDDLHDHLGRGQTLEHVGTDAAVCGSADKVLDDLVADVRLKQCQTDLAHGGLDVGFCDTAFAAQLFERCGQFFG